MKIYDRLVLLIAFAYSIFHTLVLLHILPYDIVWGGKLSNPSVLFVLEGIALLVMLLLGVLILIKNNLMKCRWRAIMMKRFLIGFSIFFMLNTVGNLLAETLTEKAQAVMTVLLALALWQSSQSIKSL